MDLSEEEKQLLDGAQGNAARTSMEILAALGEIYGAPRLVPVSSVQIAGVSYHNLGEAGLDFLEQMATDGRVRVPSFLNPAGMDRDRCQLMGITEEFERQQLRVLAAFERMGVTASCTCTPYHAGLRPARGEHLAWAESSAVTFANSVLGARSNREGGPSALAAALTGRTPIYGLHTDAGRQPTHRVVVTARLADPHDWGMLGAAIGRQAPGALPMIEAAAVPDESSLKALCAALPSYGAQPMFHLAGVTPEAAAVSRPAATLTVDASGFAAVQAALQDPGEELDLVALGCPHASLEELRHLKARLGSRRATVPIWVSTSRAVFDLARADGLLEVLEEQGVRIWADTCFAVAPLRGRFRHVATDSAKGCYYGRGHNGFAMRLGSLERCVDAAIEGRWR